MVHNAKLSEHCWCDPTSAFSQAATEQSDNSIQKPGEADEGRTNEVMMPDRWLWISSMGAALSRRLQFATTGMNPEATVARMAVPRMSTAGRAEARMRVRV